MDDENLKDEQNPSSKENVGESEKKELDTNQIIEEKHDLSNGQNLDGKQNAKDKQDLNVDELNQEILLVVDKDKKEVRAVKGVDEKGNLETIEPTEEKNNQFMKYDKNSGFLDNFLKNYYSQKENRTHFKPPFFISLPVVGFVKSIELLSNMVKMPNMDEFINQSRLDTSKFEKTMQMTDEKQEFKPLDESRIKWDEFEKIGITKEKLEKIGVLDDMLNWKKSKYPINISVDIAGEKTRAEAVINFKEKDNGEIGLNTTLVRSPRNEQNIDRYVYGTPLTTEDRKNLLETGNAGRLIPIKSGDTTKDVFVSLDKVTNQIVTVDADKIKIPDYVLGVKLDDNQKRGLASGEGVLVEGMQSKKGGATVFDAVIQINAAKRSFDFDFKNQVKQDHTQQNDNSQQQKNEQHFKRMYRLKEKDLDETQSVNLSKGKTVYIEGMKDDKGESFNAYVKMNPDTHKPRFYTKNPDLAKEVIPDNNSKTQVAVNSEGKTNEATKNVNEPLKQGQQQPTQEQKQQEAEEKKKTVKIRR